MRCDKPQKVPLHPRGAPYPSVCWWDLLAVLSQSPYGALDSECRREVSFDTKRCATAGVAAPPSTISTFLMGLPYSALLLVSSGFNIAPLRSKLAKDPLVCPKRRILALGSPREDFPFPQAAEASKPIVNRPESSFERFCLS